MAKYQKRVVEIEAFQLGTGALPMWFNKVVGEGRVRLWANGSNYIELLTDKGYVRGYKGDYVIMNELGEVYICKKQLFENTYFPLDPQVCEEAYEDKAPDPIQEIGIPG